MTDSWINQAVRHGDGRTGVIVASERQLAANVLSIAVEGGGVSYIHLNHLLPDAGEDGWFWLCTSMKSTPKWIPLGHRCDKYLELQDCSSDSRLNIKVENEQYQSNGH